jgi:hypothetical protein
MINTNQDSRREKILIEKIKLTPKSLNSRGLYDACDDDGNIFELKSTSKSTVSTARDCSLRHIERWKKLYWLIGVWNCSNMEYNDVYFLSPIMMLPWITKIESKIVERFSLIESVFNLSTVCEHDRKLCLNIINRGCTLNNPSIPLSYVVTNGCKVRSSYELKLLIKDNPVEVL